MPVGLGEPEFGKLHAQLGAAMLSINAVKGFEYGEGFAGASWRGSQQNDPFISTDHKIHTQTNHSWWHTRWQLAMEKTYTSE